MRIRVSLAALGWTDECVRPYATLDARLSTGQILCLAYVGAVLEVVLENLGG